MDLRIHKHAHIWRISKSIFHYQNVRAEDLFWYYSNTLFLFFQFYLFLFPPRSPSPPLSLCVCASFSMVSSNFIMSKAFENMINFVLKTHSCEHTHTNTPHIFVEDRRTKNCRARHKERDKGNKRMESIYFDIACPNARTINRTKQVHPRHIYICTHILRYVLIYFNG